MKLSKNKSIIIPTSFFAVFTFLIVNVFDVSAGVDCGFHFKDSSAIVKASCEPAGTLTSPLRIRKNSTTYGIELVDPANASATKMRIKTAQGIKAVKKYNPVCQCSWLTVPSPCPKWDDVWPCSISLIGCLNNTGVNSGTAYYCIDSVWVGKPFSW